MPNWFYAVAPHSPDLLHQIATTWRARRHENEKLHLYALVDGAMDPGFTSFCKTWGWPVPTSLHRHGDHKEQQAFPYIVALPPDDAEFERAMARLLPRFDGIPALSFFTSSLDSESLVYQFERLLNAVDEDGQKWWLRFADTRSQQQTFALLTQAQHQQCLAGIDTWLTITREGELAVMPGHPNGEPATDWPFPQPLPLSNRQLFAMTGDREADAVLARIDDEYPDLIRSRPAIEQFTRASRALQTLTQHGIEGDHDRHVFVITALIHPGDCTKDHVFMSMVEAAERGDVPLAQLLTQHLAPDPGEDIRQKTQRIELAKWTRALQAAARRNAPFLVVPRAIARMRRGQ